MGFRLDVQVIRDSYFYYKEDKVIDLPLRIEQLYYGTKLVGYEDEENLRCIDYLKSRSKDYPCAQYCNTRTVLDYNEFSDFIKLYMADFLRINEIDLKENEEFYESLIKHLDDTNILGYIVGWC